MAKILLCISDETWAQDFLDMLELLKTMGLLKLDRTQLALRQPQTSVSGKEGIDVLCLDAKLARDRVGSRIT